MYATPFVIDESVNDVAEAARFCRKIPLRLTSTYAIGACGVDSAVNVTVIAPPPVAGVADVMFGVAGVPTGVTGGEDSDRRDVPAAP